MANTYQTNRAGSGGGIGISEPYVQGVVVGDWSTSSVPGVKSTGSFFFPTVLGGAVIPDGTEVISINGQNFTVFYNWSGELFPGDPGEYSVEAFGLADSINNHPVIGLLVEATASFSTVSIEATTEGVSGDAITLGFSNYDISFEPSITPMSGGVDPIVDPDYTLTIDAATHDKGTEPTVTLYEENGGLFEEVDTYVAIDATGNITIKVPVSPDGRFTGKIVVN